MNRSKVFFVTTLAALVVCTGAYAQPGGDEPVANHATVQVSFFPPLGTNGVRSPEYTNDFSFNILAGISKNERAFALAGLANVILQEAEGFQLAGLANYTGHRAEGFQFGGLANLVRGSVEGFQFAGLLNTTADLEGFQFSGLGNVAGDVDGFQFGGLFNKAKDVDGAQFAGLLNIADHSDYPIGLVNIIKDGEMGVAAGYNELGTASLTFRSGGRVLYGILGVGYNHRVEESKNAWAAIGGFGAHIDVMPRFRINNELTVETLDCFSGDDINTFKVGYALLPAYRLVDCLEIFAGPSINYMQTDSPAMVDVLPNATLWDEVRASGLREQIHVGWQVGVQVLF